MKRERKKISELETDYQKVQFLLENKDRTSFQAKMLLIFSVVALAVLGYFYRRLDYLF